MKNAVLSLFEDKEYVKVCAPMVRYSKVQFRNIVRKYGCDLCFSPMIVANSFVQSSKARDIEFTSFDGVLSDRPLIVQFASSCVKDFVDAAEFVAQHCDGIDLNCGCPQKWALKSGFGCGLLSQPEIIHDCVKQLRNRLPEHKTVSVKIRLYDDVRKTVELAQSLEAAGVSLLTVHARTPDQRSEPINMDALIDVRKSVSIPVIANGDVKSLVDADYLHNATNCQGIMAARGILQNPGLFAGHKITQLCVIEDWLSMKHPNFFIFHNHLVFMLTQLLTRAERRVFNYLKTAADVVEFIKNKFGIVPKNDFSVSLLKPGAVYDSGKFFLEHLKETENGPEDSEESRDYFEGISDLYI